MDSPHTSEPKWRFTDRSGAPIQLPQEWTPAFIVIDVPARDWEVTEVWVQGISVPVQVHRLLGRPAVVAPWDRSPSGRYRIEVGVGTRRTQRDVTVAPSKISQSELDVIILDLETRLAPTIALSLQRMGAFAGLRIAPPGDTTLAAEMHRVRLAVNGDDAHRGLASLVPEIGRDPHRMLRIDEPWVRSDAARRPAPVRLAAALSKPNNLDDDQRPVTVADRRVEHTFDVYENRLLRHFLSTLGERLRRLRSVAASLRQETIAEEADELYRHAQAIERSASFLREVSRLPHGPRQVSMVLIKRPAYREMLLAYQRYRRHMTVLLDDSLLDAPLLEVPKLYEMWGTMKVAETLLAVGADLGFRVDANELVRRRGGDLRLVLRGSSVRISHPRAGVTVRFREQPTYGSASSPHSITFQQVPDIGIEVRRPGSPPQLHVLDPKYKLRSSAGGVGEDEDEADVFPGGPTKADIDKMHAYRDAIRRSDGSHAVEYAAILYPGEERTFTAGLEAIQCRPGRSDRLEAKLRERITEWLAPVDSNQPSASIA